MISDEERLRLLATLVRKFPADDPRIDLGAQWEREGVVVSVSLGRDGMFVSLNGCSSRFETASELVAAIEDVFADRLVGVTAYADAHPIYSALSRPDDPSAGFGRLDGPSGFDMPQIDVVQIQSWSGALDEERAFDADSDDSL